MKRKTLRQKFDELFDLFTTRNMWGLSASIGFYTVLSLTPFLLVLFTLTALFGWENSDEFRSGVQDILGASAAIGLDAISTRLESEQGMLGFGVIGFVAVVWSSSGVVGEIQDALNRVLFDPQTADETKSDHSALRQWLQLRFFAIAAVIFCVLVSLSSFVATVALKLMVSEADENFWNIIKSLGSFAIFAVMFQMMFRYLPRRSPQPGFAWNAGILCATLFLLGRLALEFYFAHSGMQNVYGALSSFIVLLVWAQYNGLIILISASIAKVFFRKPFLHHYKRHFRSRLHPKDHLSPLPLNSPNPH